MNIERLRFLYEKVSHVIANDCYVPGTLAREISPDGTRVPVEECSENITELRDSHGKVSILGTLSLYWEEVRKGKLDPGSGTPIFLNYIGWNAFAEWLGISIKDVYILIDLDEGSLIQTLENALKTGVLDLENR